MSELRFGPPPESTYTVEPTQDEVAFYQENGYLVVDRITTDAEIEWLTKIFQTVFDEPNPATFSPGQDPGYEGPTMLRQSMFPEFRFPEVLQSTYHRNARRYASALMGLPESELTTWGHMIEKPPLHSLAAPWHQDEAYWEPELDYNAIGTWLPLHDVSVERGCMQFIPGSHKGNVLMHNFKGDVRGNLLVADGVDESKAVACPLTRGGATFHHPRTLHYTAPNTTDRPRLAYPIEFQVHPVPRHAPADRPWVYAFRDAVGGGLPKTYVADGRMVPTPL
jgi:hypothetical protein